MAFNPHALPEESEHNRLYRQAVQLVEPHLPLHGIRPTRPGFLLRRRLRKGVALLDQVLALNPKNWAAMWVAGMTCRRLGELERAMDYFAAACELSRDPNVAREAGITAMDMGRYEQSVEYTTRAIDLDPSDAGLVANLALAHLLNQNVPEAKRAIDAAVAADAADEINQHLLRIVNAVLAGERPCPRSKAEMMRA